MSVRFQRKNLPLSALFLLQILSLVWGQGSQAPPTTFGSESVTGSATTQATSTAPSSLSANSTSASVTQTSSAQLPTLSGYSACVVNATQLAVSDMNCESIAQFECYCTNASFSGALISRMMQSDCQHELSTAEGLAQQFCNIASTSVSFSVTSFTPTGSSTSNGQTSTSSNPSGGSGGQNGGNGAIGSFTPASAVGLSVALIGVALGALIV
ncbi:hypothetical protein PM082_015288 [Marasmius tenuissimus]|nr:hypothetical protein PM082_015288 [Marasmius tenuissimus]